MLLSPPTPTTPSRLRIETKMNIVPPGPLDLPFMPVVADEVEICVLKSIIPSGALRQLPEHSILHFNASLQAILAGRFNTCPGIHLPCSPQLELKLAIFQQ